MTPHCTARSPARPAPLLRTLVAVLGLLVTVAAGGVLPARAAPTPAATPSVAPTMALSATPSVAPSVAPSASVPAQDQEPDLRLLLDDVRPTVSGPGIPLLLTGTLTNLGAEPVPVDTVQVRTAYQSLDTREKVQAWETTGSLDTPIELGTDVIDAAIVPGATVTWFVRVPGDALAPNFDFATLPVTIEVTSDASTTEDLEPEAEPPETEPPETEPPETTGLLASQRTFLPWQAADAESFNPIDLAWVAPVTLPGGTDLSSGTEAEWTQAWSEAIGRQSTNVAVLEGLAGTEATFLVDPAVLDPLRPVDSLIEEHLAQQDPTEPPTDPDPSQPDPSQPEPSAPDPTLPDPSAPGATEAPADTSPGTDTPPPGPGVTVAPDQSLPTEAPEAPAPPGSDPGTTTEDPSQDPLEDDAGGTADDAEDTQAPGADRPQPPEESDPDRDVQALRELLTQVPENQLWWLPAGDTDLSALLQGGVDTDLIADLVSRPGVPELPPGRTDAAWPAPTTLSDETVDSLRGVWAASGGPTGADQPGAGELATVLVPVSASAEGPFTEEAAVPHPSGTVLLGYDERLSGIVGGSAAADRDATTVQRFLAETLATYQEFPANDRSLVVAVPRGVTLEATTLRSLTESTESARWLAPTSALDLVQGAPQQDPATLTGTDQEEPDPDDPARITQVGGSPLTPHRVSGLEDTRDRLRGAAQMVPDTEAAAATWDRVLDRQYSTGWRLTDQDWGAPVDRAAAIADEVLAGVRINPTAINFLADEGLIQITVVNELPVPVEDLQMAVSPGNARLRVPDQPDPFTIGAESRATVQFRAQAMASGQVPLNIMLSTENGTRVGDTEKMQVRVQPTGIWIYWVLGGVAGAILILGLVRALRPRTRQHPDETTTDTPVSAPEST